MKRGFSEFLPDFRSRFQQFIIFQTCTIELFLDKSLCDTGINAIDAVFQSPKCRPTHTTHTYTFTQIVQSYLKNIHVEINENLSPIESAGLD